MVSSPSLTWSRIGASYGERFYSLRRAPAANKDKPVSPLQKLSSIVFLVRTLCVDPVQQLTGLFPFSRLFCRMSKQNWTMCTQIYRVALRLFMASMK